MTVITAATPLIGPTKATRAQADAYIAPHNPQRPDFLAAYLDALWTLCQGAGVPFEIAVGQAITETAFFTSSWFIQRGNVAGIGITGDAAQNNASPTFAKGAQAARAQIAHLVLYATGTIDRGGLTPADDSRFAAYRNAYGSKAIAPTLAGLAGNWATDPTYATQIAAHAAGILAMPIPAPSPGGNPMPDSYTYAPTPFRKQLLPVGWPTRPGAKLRLDRGWIGVTVHETANEAVGANAAMHANWVQSQDAVRSQVSVSFFVDDHEIVQIVPLDEITWHAGDGCDDPATDIGCFYTLSIEKCVNADGNEAKANENLAELIARLAAGDPAFDWGSGSTKGKVSTDRLYQHIQVSQEVPPHDCPNHIRHETLPGWTWDQLMKAVDWFGPYVTAYLKGTTPAPQPQPKPTPAPSYATPIPATASSTCLPYPVTGTATHAVTPRQRATKSAKATGPAVAAGTKVAFAFTIWSQTDKAFWLIDAKGQRFPASSFAL